VVDAGCGLIPTLSRSLEAPNDVTLLLGAEATSGSLAEALQQMVPGSQPADTLLGLDLQGLERPVLDRRRRLGDLTNRQGATSLLNFRCSSAFPQLERAV
jgi:hypothetical protein